MPVFEQRSRIAASPERVFAFHESPGALQRLTPPWERARVIEASGGLEVGARVVLELGVGPVKTRWVAEHTRYERPRMFEDVQRSGPFRRWVHTHTMASDGAGGCWLIDRIDYELPLGRLGALLGGPFVRRKLARMFAYRHDTTRRACEAETSRD